MAPSIPNYMATLHNSTGLNTKSLTFEQRQLIVAECCEDMVSPTDLARKWSCNADTIRTWVRKAGRQLPKQYKKSIYSEDGTTQLYEPLLDGIGGHTHSSSIITTNVKPSSSYLASEKSITVTNTSPRVASIITEKKKKKLPEGMVDPAMRRELVKKRMKKNSMIGEKAKTPHPIINQQNPHSQPIKDLLARTVQSIDWDVTEDWAVMEDWAVTEEAAESNSSPLQTGMNKNHTQNKLKTQKSTTNTQIQQAQTSTYLPQRSSTSILATKKTHNKLKRPMLRISDDKKNGNPKNLLVPPEKKAKTFQESRVSKPPAITKSDEKFASRELPKDVPINHETDQNLEVEVIGERISIAEQIALQQQNIDLQKQLDKTMKLLKQKSSDCQQEEAERLRLIEYYQNKTKRGKDENTKLVEIIESQQKQIEGSKEKHKTLVEESQNETRENKRKIEEMQTFVMKSERDKLSYKSEVNLAKEENQRLSSINKDNSDTLANLSNSMLKLSRKLSYIPSKDASVSSSNKPTTIVTKQSMAEEAKKAFDKLSTIIQNLKSFKENVDRENENLTDINSRNKLVFEKLKKEVNEMAESIKKREEGIKIEQNANCILQAEKEKLLKELNEKESRLREDKKERRSKEEELQKKLADLKTRFAETLIDQIREWSGNPKTEYFEVAEVKVETKNSPKEEEKPEQRQKYIDTSDETTMQWPPT